MRIGSLFSGAGGLDMAVERVFDSELVWHCEYDAAASRVLEYRWPGIPNHRDVTTTNWGLVEPIDILCGGYPCQPFSSAGQRKGANDERHLWPYFLTAIRHLRPRYVVLENVAGHRTMGFSRVLGDLAEVGFDADWCSVRASDVGAPHGRERLFALAYPRHVGLHRTANDARRREPNFAGSDVRVQPCGRRTATPNANGHGFHRGTQRHLEQATTLTTPFGYHSDRCAVGDGGAVGCTDWGQYADAIANWERLTRPSPDPSESGKNGPRIAAAFSEWLMGWPQGWVTDVPGLSRKEQLHIIGNGVCPQQAEAALLSLLFLSAVA